MSYFIESHERIKRILIFPTKSYFCCGGSHLAYSDKWGELTGLDYSDQNITLKIKNLLGTIILPGPGNIG